MSSLCRNYTKALLDSSAVEKATHFVKLLEKLSKYFEYEEFIKVIESPAIPRASKENFIFSIVDIKDSQFINFIRVLNENNRIFLIPYIHRDLVQLMRIYSNEYEMIVYSSFKLSESELSMIRDFVSNKINTSLHANVILDTGFVGVIFGGNLHRIRRMKYPIIYKRLAMLGFLSSAQT